MRQNTWVFTSMLVILSVLSISVDSQCPELYQRYSQQHTYCLKPNSSCTIIAKGVGKDHIKEILDAHNEHRSRIAMGHEAVGNLPQASDMLEMEWDEELAEVAQKFAEQCAMVHDCGDCRRVKNFGVGQNLAMTITPEKGLKEQHWAKKVAGWYREVDNFHSKIIASYDSSKGTGVIGHFTQVIWSKSWRVGCGFASLVAGGDETEHLYACNYGPAGNMRNRYVYKEGKTCSECPDNTCCSGDCGGGEPSFPGLCRVMSGRYPLYPEPSAEYLYLCDFTPTACAVSVPSGMKIWEISSTFSGFFAGVVLNGGESSILNFTTVIQPSPTICWSITYRKGPNVAGQADVGVAKVISHWIDNDSYRERILRSQSGLDFTGFKFTTPFNMKLELAISFEVPAGSPAQYMEVSQLSVKEGRCS